MSMNDISGVVTIKGIGFSTPQEGQAIPTDYRVKFQAVSGSWIAPFEGDYLSWTDTEIKVKVPSMGYFNDTQDIIKDINEDIACTGQIRVCKDTKFLGVKTSCGCSSTSADKLYIPFSARNTYQVNAKDLKESVRTTLRNFDGNGGYAIYLHPNFKAKLEAITAFKRALTTWRCATKVNYKLDEVNVFSGSVPGNCFVKFGILPIGTTTVTKGGTLYLPEDCGKSPNIKLSYLPGFIMTFNNQLEWYTGTDEPILNPATQADLESIALHELGHAHLLNHTSNTPNVMLHPSAGGYRRELHIDDENGGNHLSILGSTINDPLCPSSVMELISPTQCNINATIEYKGNNSIEVLVFPNPTQNVVTIDFKANQEIEGFVKIMATNGDILSSQKLKANKTVLDISDIPVGLYYVIYEDETGRLTLINKTIKN